MNKDLMGVGKITVCIMCFAFLLVSHVSISNASQFVEKKPVYEDEWLVEVRQKVAENQDYMEVYRGSTQGNKAEELTDGTIMYSDSTSCFIIEQKDNHYVLKVQDVQLRKYKYEAPREKAYSNVLEFDMAELKEKPHSQDFELVVDPQGKSETESEITFYADNDRIKITVSKRRVEVPDSFLILY